MCFWKPFWVHEPVNNLWKRIGMLGDQNLGFGVKNGSTPWKIMQNWWLFASARRKRALSKQLLEVVRLSEQSFAQAKCSLTVFPVSCSCIFFTHFCFELAFGVNMKVLDNWISFSMDLVWHQNDFYSLSYDENTPSRSWRNFK